MVSLIRKGKVDKIECEICGLKEPSALEVHHIVHRADGGDDNYWNRIIICGSCHNKHHHKDSDFKIIAMYPSTKLPYARTAIYEENGVKNIDLEPYYTIKKEDNG